MNIAIIGAGKWGINHVKTAFKILDRDYSGKYTLTACDTDKSSEEKVKKISPQINFTLNFGDIIDNKDINLVIVATPAETHYEITKELINAGKNVLTEKPLTLTSKETEDLIVRAEHKQIKLMTGHVLLFHPAIVKIKELVENGSIGKLLYIYSNRLNLGMIRKQENILFSFAPHDISIIQYILNSFPDYVYASGPDILQKGIEDSTITILKYPDGIHCHIFVSWLHPFKEQRFVVIGEKGMLVFEDSLKDEKLKFYKKGFSKVKGELEKFDSHYEVISFDDTQPLENEQLHFIESVQKNKRPITDGYHALEVLQILEKAQISLKNN